MAPQNDSPPKLIVASHLLSLRCSHVFIFCLLQGLLLPFRDCSCIDALAGGIGSGKVPPSFILNWTIYSEDENVVVHVSRILQSIFLLYRFVHNFTKSLVVICPSQPGWKYTIFSRTFRIKNQMLQFRWPGPQMRYWRWLVDNPIDDIASLGRFGLLPSRQQFPTPKWEGTKKWWWCTWRIIAGLWWYVVNNHGDLFLSKNRVVGRQPWGASAFFET